MSLGLHYSKSHSNTLNIASNKAHYLEYFKMFRNCYSKVLENTFIRLKYHTVKKYDAKIISDCQIFFSINYVETVYFDCKAALCPTWEIKTMPLFY